MSDKFELGYTAGAFDLFHVGHLRFLKRASELCDRLIVGVSTSESMKHFKGIKPIISFEQRIEIIRSLPFVYKATPNDTTDHEKVRNEIGFDVFIIGNDWMNKLPDDIMCPVIYLPYTTGISSGIIKNRIRSMRIMEPEFA